MLEFVEKLAKCFGVVAEQEQRLCGFGRTMRTDGANVGVLPSERDVPKAFQSKLTEQKRRGHNKKTIKKIASTSRI